MYLSTDAINQDLRLLDLRGLKPLHPDMVGGELDLMAMVDQHNRRCARATARLRQILEERQRQANFGSCEDKTGAELIAERARLCSATWDALRELRHTFEERQHVLVEIEQRLWERYDAAGEEHNRAVAAAEQRLAGERRRLERINPGAAGRHFADLVAEDHSVEDTANQKTAMRNAYESAAEVRRNLGPDRSAVTARQRELFTAMVNGSGSRSL